ncbi:MAG: malto-oligosyltrehalose synthase, partial [Gemmatimonadota bacterium]
EGMDRGWPKLWVVRQALRVRRDRRESLRGDYVALDTTGHAASHVLGFLRGGDVAVVVPRLPIRLARDGGWRDTTVALPEGRWSNVLTGERVNADAAGSRAEVASLLGRFPVALLVREDG